MTKRILITGANKGIGLATVAAVLRTDANTHVLLGSRDLSRGQSARTSLLETNADWTDRIAVIALDVGKDSSVASAVETVRGMYPGEDTPLYGVINNAGIGLGAAGLHKILNVNTEGPHRVCEAFLPLLDPETGRIVNVSSASGPMFVAKCSPERQQMFVDPSVTWDRVAAIMAECREIAAAGGNFAAAGLAGDAYGLSKACLNAYTIHLARTHPNLTINACTPGFIETDLTRPYAESQGVTPQSMGMKSPSEGTKASVHLLLGEPGGKGWFFGSDAVRSPLDRYRSPGDPPYEGD